MSWNQPICRYCWNERYPLREPIRVSEEHARKERCAYCGDHTSGIYVRANPKNVPYPSEER